MENGTIYICSHFNQKTENRMIFLNPFTVYASCKQKFVVFPFYDEETNGSYPFPNELNGPAHLWISNINYWRNKVHATLMRKPHPPPPNTGSTVIYCWSRQASAINLLWYNKYFYFLDLQKFRNLAILHTDFVFCRLWARATLHTLHCTSRPGQVSKSAREKLHAAKFEGETLN
jgi:hypothetical protein